MLVALALVWTAALIGAGANDTGQASPVLKDRLPLLVHLGPASGPLEPAQTQRLLAALGPAVEHATALRVEAVSASLDAKAVERCGGGTSFRCWVDLVRPGGARPVDRRGAGAAPLLLVMNALGVEGSEMRFGVFLLDMERAAAVIEESSSAEDADVLEGRIYDRAVKNVVVALALDDSARLDAALVQLWDGPFKSALEDARVLVGSTRLQLDTDVAGLRVELDGQSIATTQAGSTIIDGVVTGHRTLHLVDPSELRVHAPLELELVRGKALRISPELQAAAANPVRTVTFWTGVGIGTVGVVLTVLAIAVPKSGVDVRTCVTGCPSGESNFARTSDYFSDNAEASSGPQLAPLGYSLAGGGATMAVGTLLIGESNEVPWIPIAMGLLVGGLGIGLSEALD